MNQMYSFKFMDPSLNRKLLALLKKAQVKHTIGADGVVRYSPCDEELVGNELIPSIRRQVFRSWQILSCPKVWAARYKRYMRDHDVPYTEELIDNQLCFLLPRRYRPHSWTLGKVSSSSSC
jgi:hypothetical protein